MDVSHLFGVLVVMLLGAKAFGALAQRIGQPAVLGELVAGVLLGTSVLGLVNPRNEVLHVMAELGVVILLFEIGLETDLRKLLQVGGTSSAVAIVGVVLPFGLGYGVCRILGLDHLSATVTGATLTATSVGITARVLSDLNRLQEPESQIILGAAVIDDVLGLMILAVVAGLTRGQDVTLLGIARTSAVAVGFLLITLLFGRLTVPALVRLGRRLPGTPTMLAVILAFALAWLASTAGLELIIGAFAAGLLLRDTPQAHDIERGVSHLGHFFVPLFFVTVGAAVDVRVLSPLDAANRPTLLVGGLLIAVAVVGKFLAGYAPWWFRGNKNVIGIGMVPRGEVGLIFAQMGLTAGVFDPGFFSAVTLTVMVTTFIAPPLLRLLFPPTPLAQQPVKPEGVQELVTEA
jgi:Kef-type K+ transport system membrane component KefB